MPLMRDLQARLDLILERIDSPKFGCNDGLGNEIGFWVFDYPAQHELIVRNHVDYLVDKLQNRGKNFKVLNLFQVIVDMLESRNLLERAFQREKQVGVSTLIKTLKAPLSQDKIAKFIAEKYPVDDLEFLVLTGVGSAWPLIRGHEVLSALQDVMGSTPLVMFYPGEYSGLDLHLFGKIESQNYYRAFKLVPESDIK
jgi:hypothetical protein